MIRLATDVQHLPFEIVNSDLDCPKGERRNALVDGGKENCEGTEISSRFQGRRGVDLALLAESLRGSEHATSSASREGRIWDEEQGRLDGL